jgi:hypothetical protein
MLIFPQLSTGAMTQYPVIKKRIERAIQNLTEDGHAIVLGDTGASMIEWDLRLAGLSDAEANGMVAFFQSCEGKLQSFTFLDPTANLFAYSEDYTQPAWQRNTLLGLSEGITDPFGTVRASHLSNPSPGSLLLTQTVQIPGSIWCAFSLYLRASQPFAFQMSRTDGSTVTTQAVDPTGSWQRFSLSSIFSSSTSEQCDFSLTLPPGAAVDIFGAQLDAQPFAGKYIQNLLQTGVYLTCRFNVDQLTVVATGPSQSSVNIAIVSKTSE